MPNEDYDKDVGKRLKTVPHREFFYYKGARKTLLLRIKLEEEKLDGYYNMAINRFVKVDENNKEDLVMKLMAYQAAGDFGKSISYVISITDEIVEQTKKRRIKHEIL